MDDDIDWSFLRVPDNGTEFTAPTDRGMVTPVREAKPADKVEAPTEVASPEGTSVVHKFFRKVKMGSGEHKYVCNVCFPVGTVIDQSAKNTKGGVYHAVEKGTQPGTAPRRLHLDHHHKELFEAEKVKMKGQEGGVNLDAAKPGPSGLPICVEKYLVYLSKSKTSPTMAASQAARDAFPRDYADMERALKGKTLNRKNISKYAEHFSDYIKNEVHIKMLGNDLSLLLDVGTLHRQQLLNACVVSARTGVAYFWSSTPMLSTTADALKEVVLGLISDIEKIGCNVRVVVTDNASNFRKMADDMKDDEERAMADEDDAVADDDDMFDDADLAELDFGTTTFLYHVRCWAHSFQLVIKDMSKNNKHVKKGFDCLRRVMKAMTNKGRRALETAGASSKLVDPTETRWNSSVRAMHRIINLKTEISVVLTDLNLAPISGAELAHMQLAVCVLAPICWATDKVQADNVTMVGAEELMNEVLRDFETMDAQCASSAEEFTKVHVRAAIVSAKKILKARTEKNFRNRITELLRILNVRTNTATVTYDERERVATDVKNYWAYKNDPKLNDLIDEQLFAFWSRGECETEETAQKYIKHMTTEQALIFGFFGAMQKLAVTEAAVERTFHSENLIWTKERNKMHIETVDHWLQILWNYPRIRPVNKVQRQRRRPEDLTHAQWEIMLGEIVGVNTGGKQHNTRKVEQKWHQIKLHAVVEILWAVLDKPGTFIWRLAYVSSVKSGVAGRFTVIYPGDQVEVGDFNPVGKDNEWGCLKMSLLPWW